MNVPLFLFHRGGDGYESVCKQHVWYMSESLYCHGERVIELIARPFGGSDDPAQGRTGWPAPRRSGGRCPRLRAWGQDQAAATAAGVVAVLRLLLLAAASGREHVAKRVGSRILVV